MNQVETRPVVVEVELPGGEIMLVQTVDVELPQEELTGDVAGVRAPDLRRFDLRSVVNQVQGLSGELSAALAESSPDSITLELQIGLSVGSGGLVAFLAASELSSSLSVSLTWTPPARKEEPVAVTRAEPAHA